ncbi:MAG: hypothetical protein A3G76_12270 [Acidobacteria bacterium RIFCSPLOWO2_12_FULL_65_11]|nr:MAG: hypothetical protein A3H95_05520 [Acidobacteria bacterium RIFCSPLOWO2_02_FULL_64_15]OFW31568.1 MAG: hypothetical protein A3G76_12270 [Acidobacteria bacterium RIFCSPLOWO2_12_FULL_65_11]
MGTSYRHRGGEAPLLGATISEHFAQVASRFADREAVVGRPQQRRLSYAQLTAAVDELARGLIGIGFGRGDRIGVRSTNNIEWPLLQMATARIGAVLVTINPAYRTRELQYALSKSEVQGLFLVPSFRTSDYVAMLIELLPGLKACPADGLRAGEFPSLRRVVLFDPQRLASTERPHQGFQLWHEVIGAGAAVGGDVLDRVTATLDRDDPINIQYTSGTTGFPKAVVLTHHQKVVNRREELDGAPAARIVDDRHAIDDQIAEMDCLQIRKVDDGVAVRVAAPEPEHLHFDAAQIDGSLIRERDVRLAALVDPQEVRPDVLVGDDVDAELIADDLVAADVIAMVVAVEDVLDRQRADRLDGREHVGSLGRISTSCLSGNCCVSGAMLKRPNRVARASVSLSLMDLEQDEAA